jgi:AraC family ethanolamine operon transcriptional activator
VDSNRLEPADVPALKDFSVGVPLYHRFSDIDELATYVPEGKNIRLTQLGFQPFQCDSITLNLGVVRFSFNHLHCATKVAGNKTPGFLYFVCFPFGLKRPVISHARPVTQDFLYGFDPNRTVDQIIPGNSIHCSVSIRAEVFDTITEVMDRPDLNTTFLTSHYTYAPDTLPPLRAYLKQLYELGRHRSPLLQQPNFQQLIVQDYLPLLITTLPLQHDPLKIRLKSFQRSHLVKQAEDYMQTHIDQPLTLTDLCDALDTCSRALSYGFQEMFGMSPMAYLKTLRLQAVHRALKTADPLDTKITTIANQFGFWSMGHFTRDYKTMFGELPSETLKR